MTDSTSAANAMDRLSDWVGSFVPGCARLGPRHPVKVSLVAGGLGLLAGWLTVVPIVVIESFYLNNLRWVFHILPGLFLGAVLFVPLLAWQQRSRGWIMLSLLLSLAAGAVHTGTLEYLNGPEIGMFTIVGTLAGAVYAAAGMLVNTRRAWWMLAPVMSVSGLLHAAITVSAETTNSFIANLPFQLSVVLSMSFSANLFAGVYAALGITLGSALWDRTPRPKFEANFDGSREESES